MIAGAPRSLDGVINVLMVQKYQNKADDQTCNMEREPSIPRTSQFEYPHPLRSAMTTNFSCPVGILARQGLILVSIFFDQNYSCVFEMSVKMIYLEHNFSSANTAKPVV